MTQSVISFPVLPLVVLLALLGHDAVMAANPHGGAEMSHHAARGAGDMASDMTCHVPEGIRATPPGVPAPDTSSSVLIAVVLMPLRQEVRQIATGMEPDHPPNVRRAFLQVYLN